jgi:hypothetical protein
VEGFTITDKSAPWTTWRENEQSRMALAKDATSKERILDERSIAFNLLGMKPLLLSQSIASAKIK